MLARAQRAHEAATVGQNELFGGGGTREPIALPQVEPWLPAERLQREYDAVGFFLSGHPLDDYAAVLKNLRVQSWAEFSRAVKAGATAGRVAGTVVSRTERRTKTGNKMGIIGLSDPSGHYEAVMFAEGLPSTATCSSPARRCCCSSRRKRRATRCARASSRPSRSIRPPPSCRRACACSCATRRRSRRSPSGWSERHAAKGDGEVSMVLMLEQGTEVEVKLPGRFKVSPQIAGAIKAVPGVVQVEAL